MVLVPLLETEPTRHALDLACRLARERGTHVVLIAPLVVDWELPFNAHFRQEETALGEELATSGIWSRVTGSPPAARSCGLGPARSAERWPTSRATPTPP